MKNRFWLKVRNDDSSADMYIYDDIGASFWGGGVSAADVADQLKGLKDSVKTINCHVNSPGGDVFDGVAIYNLLAQHKATVNMYVDALAASAASVVCMAGDQIHMPENAMMMIHDPWTQVAGNATDLRKMADDLDKIRDVIALSYQRRTDQDLTTIKNWMGDETWMTAQECKDRGFADEIIPGKAPAAALDRRYLNIYRNVPVLVKNAATGSEDFPLSERGHTWDAGAADDRWRSHCSSDGSGSKDKMDWPKYRTGHFYYDPSNAESFGGYKLPFVDVLGGKPSAIWRGITAAAGRLDGTDISTDDKSAIQAHIESYYAKAATQYGDDTIQVPWKSFDETQYLRDRLKILTMA